MQERKIQAYPCIVEYIFLKVMKPMTLICLLMYLNYVLTSSTQNKQTKKQLPDHPGMPPPSFVLPSQFHPEYKKASLVTQMEKAMAPHSSTLAWKIPWMEEPSRLQSMGSLRVRHDWETSLWLFTFMHWRRKWQPTPVFLPGESQGWRSLVGCRLWGRTVGQNWSD